MNKGVGEMMSVGWISLAMISFGCNDTSNETHSILIDWNPEPTYLGIYYAQDTGLFREEGLNVEIENVQGAHRAVSALRAGRHLLSTASGAATVLSYNQEQPVVSLAVLYPNVTTAVYGLNGASVSSAADIRGMNIGIYPGSINNQEFSSFMRNEGVAREEVVITPISGSDVALILQGEIDGAVNYYELSPELLRAELEKRGIERTVWELRLSDYVDLGYGLNLVTTQAVLSARQEEVQRAVGVILKAYERACDNRDEAVTVYSKRFAQFDRSYVSRSWERVCSEIGASPGTQTLEGWLRTISAAVSFDLIEAGSVNAEEIMVVRDN